MNKIILSILISCSIFSCIEQEQGCMDCLASNFSSSADIPDNSCQFNLYSDWNDPWIAQMALDSGIINIYSNGILSGNTLVNDSIYEDIFPQTITFDNYTREYFISELNILQNANLSYSNNWLVGPPYPDSSNNWLGQGYPYSGYGEYTKNNDLINIDFNGMKYLTTDSRSFFGIPVPNMNQKDSLFNVKSGKILTLKRDSLVYRYQIQANINDTSSQITNEIDITRTIIYIRKCNNFYF
jgi:hypothetical protein